MVLGTKFKFKVLSGFVRSLLSSLVSSLIIDFLVTVCSGWTELLRVPQPLISGPLGWNPHFTQLPR